VVGVIKIFIIAITRTKNSFPIPVYISSILSPQFSVRLYFGYFLLWYSFLIYRKGLHGWRIHLRRFGRARSHILLFHHSIYNFTWVAYGRWTCKNGRMSSTAWYSEAVDFLILWTSERLPAFCVSVRKYIALLVCFLVLCGFH